LLVAAGFFSAGIFADNLNAGQLKQFKYELKKMQTQLSGMQMTTKNLQKKIQAHSQARTQGIAMMKEMNRSREKVVRNIR